LWCPRIVLPFLTALVIHAAAIPALSQTTTASQIVQTGLTVHGHGDLKVKPDVAYATVTVVTQSRDQTQAISDNSDRMKAVLAAVKISMVLDRDIQTQFYTVEPQYDYRMSPPSLTGYQVSNSIRVTIHDLPKVGILLDKATRAGATSVDDVSYDLMDRSRTEGDALALAIANARSEADLMAGAAGVELGKIVCVSQDKPSDEEPGPIFAARAMSPGSQPTPVEPQMIDVAADVTIVYSIASRHAL
jgi:uncharacterized protein